ncbi:DUF4396 domain-containing protein [Oryzihumus sp.]
MRCRFMTAHQDSPGTLTRQAVQATLRCLTGRHPAGAGGGHPVHRDHRAHGHRCGPRRAGRHGRGLTEALFWTSLAVSLAAAFVVTVPVNRWLIARGRGHAVVHAHH